MWWKDQPSLPSSGGNEVQTRSGRLCNHKNSEKSDWKECGLFEEVPPYRIMGKRGTYQQLLVGRGGLTDY